MRGAARLPAPRWFLWLAGGLFAFGVIGSAGLMIDLSRHSALTGTPAITPKTFVFAIAPAVAFGAWSWLALRQMWRGRRGLAVAIVAVAYLLIAANIVWMLVMIGRTFPS